MEEEGLPGNELVGIEVNFRIIFGHFELFETLKKKEQQIEFMNDESMKYCTCKFFNKKKKVLTFTPKIFFRLAMADNFQSHAKAQ